MKNFRTNLLLHGILMLYSMGGIFGKLAGAEPMFSFKFFLYYGMVIGILGIYAIGWQQIIKRMPLTTAFANKAVTVVWGLLWGTIWFQEQITAGKIIGAVLVMIGVVMFANADGEAENVE